LIARFTGGRQQPAAQPPAGDAAAREEQAVGEVSARLAAAGSVDAGFLEATKGRFQLRTLTANVTATEATISASASPAKTIRLYKVTVDPRPQWKIIQNPANEFPRDVQEALQRAQETITYENSASARFGDGSSALGAIAEQVKGSNDQRRFSAPPASVPAIGGTLHLGKVRDNITGYTRSIRTLNAAKSGSLAAPSLRRLHGEVDYAIALIQREATKNLTAVAWCLAYRGGRTPALPSWAQEYEGLLVPLGLKRPGESYPEDPRVTVVVRETLGAPGSGRPGR
jgi:hypothetical protein